MCDNKIIYVLSHKDSILQISGIFNPLTEYSAAK